MHNVQFEAAIIIVIVVIGRQEEEVGGVALPLCGEANHPPESGRGLLVESGAWSLGRG